MTLLALSSPVFGQIDPRAEPFLDFTDSPPVTPTRTIDYTLCSIFYHGEPESEAEGELCVRTVMDFVNRRMLSQTTSRRGDDALGFEMVYADGQATMTDDMTGEPIALPQEQVALLERSFDYAADVVETGGALPNELLSATYDGVVAYGDVVSGEQITARVMARSFMLGNTSPQETTMRFVFSKDKKLLAFVSEVPQRTLLHVLENPDDPVPMRRFISEKLTGSRTADPSSSALSASPATASTRLLTTRSLNSAKPPSETLVLSVSPIANDFARDDRCGKRLHRSFGRRSATADPCFSSPLCTCGAAQPS